MRTGIETIPEGLVAAADEDAGVGRIGSHGMLEILRPDQGAPLDPKTRIAFVCNDGYGNHLPKGIGEAGAGGSSMLEIGKSLHPDY